MGGSFGGGKGNEFAFDRIPVTFRVWPVGASGYLGDKTGLDSGIGQWVGSSVGQDAAFRKLQCRESSRKKVKPAPDGGGFDSDSAPAEPVVIPTTSFWRAIDE